MKKQSLLILIMLALCVIFTSSRIEAANYYVSPTGAGSHDGSSPSNAFSLAEAQAYANSHTNETITFLLASGSYGTFSDYTNVRTAWATWKANTGAEVNFTSMYLGEWTGPYNKYLRFENINVVGGPKPGEPSNYAVYAEKVYYVEFLNMNIYGTVAYDYDSRSAGIKLFSSNKHIKIKDSIIHNFSALIGADDFGNDDILIENCTLYDAYWAILARGKNWIIRNNEWFDVWDGINMVAQDSVIEYNYIHDFIYDPIGSWHGDAIQFYCVDAEQYPKNVIIRNNFIVARTHHGIAIRCNAPELPCPNMTLENNLVCDSESTLIELNGNTNLTLRNNIFLPGPTGAGLTIIRAGSSITSCVSNIFYRFNIDDYTPINYEDYNILWHWWTRIPAGHTPGPHTVELADDVAFQALFADYANENFHLASDSLAIDSVPLDIATVTDLEGNSRIDVVGVGNEGTDYADAGCYEYGAVSLRGDLNKDGIVNIQDVQCCVNHISGTQDWGSKADVNSDGKVDEADVKEIVNIILKK